MNNSTSADEKLCDTALYLAKNMELRYLLIARCLISAVGIIFFIILFKIQGVYLAFHTNARVLLIVHHTWAITLSIVNLIAHAFDLIRYSAIYNDACDYRISTYLSVLLRGPDIICVYSEVFIMAAMAFERCVATAKFRTYESSDNSLGKRLIALQMFFSALWFILAIYDLDWSEMKAYSTVSSTKTSQKFANLMASTAVVEVLAFSVFCGLLLYNRRHKVHLTDAPLTEKYQIGENIRAISIMIPMVVTHFFCFLPTLITFPIYIKLNPELPIQDYAIFLETFRFVPLYSLILPVVLVSWHRMLRVRLKKVLRFNEIVPQEEPLEDGRTHEQMRHFELLERMWSEYETKS